MVVVSEALTKIAKAIGLEIQPAGKRGELIIIFPRPQTEPLTIRLSRKKAVELILWLYVNRKEKEVSHD